MSGRAPLTKRSERNRDALSGNVPATPGPAGLQSIASAVGNRAFAAYVATQQRVSAEPHPQLPAGTPAWAQDGEIVLGPPAALLSPQERADVVQHETIHVLQQRLAPVDETGAARDRAERLADRPRGSLPSSAELQVPAPRLLAAPVKGKAATGFTRLFAGDGKIIGEVVDSGVAVRAELGYRELGIEAPVDPKSDFGTATMTDLQFLSCGNRAFPKLQAVGTAMRAVAKQVAKVNGAIAAGSPWRVEQVFVVNEASRLHFADGQAFMVLSHTDFDSNGPETAAHEASHAVFESHSHPDPKQPGALAPDAFALRLADLFLRLAKTPPVPLPSEPFKKQKPPLKGGDGPQQPAGYVMVTDSLWSGGAATEGHPWEGVDEFVASAFGAFVRDPKLLGEMIAHYAPLDASVKSGGAELLSLLTAVKDSKPVKALAAAQQKGSTEAIRQRESQPSTIKERLGAILTPETLPPETVTCPAKALAPTAGNRSVARSLRAVARDPAPVEERRRFTEEQDAFFRETGAVMEAEIRTRAHLQHAASNADEALQVAALWGLTLDDIAAHMPAVSASLSGQVRGQQAATTLGDQAQRLVDALQPAGRRAYEQVIRQVRSEAFWRQRLDGGQIHIFPDLGGRNRYAGYTQRGNADDGPPAFIIHISAEALNAGEVDSVAATLVHELSHTVFEPSVVGRSLAPLVAGLSDLIVEHPRLQALRRGAADPGEARGAQLRQLRQLLYERTGYAEAEIFVHLQQLTHMPATVAVDGQSVRGSDQILAMVETYLERLKRIGMPPRMLRGILDSLARRTAILYDRRIAAAQEHDREPLRNKKEIALALFTLARGDTGT